MSDGQKTTTQTQTNEPWSAAQPALKTSLGEAEDLFKSGVGFQPYTGSTVVPFADQTTAGMNLIQNQATGPSANVTGRPASFYGDMFDTGGLSADQNAVADMLRTTAGGAELNQVSPAFQQLLDTAGGNARDAVNLSMSGAGRYGSGAHTDVLGRSVIEAQAPLMVGEYGRQLGRMDAARGSLANLGQQGITNLDMASSALPGAWTTGQLPATDLMKVGTMYEDLAGRTMADNQRITEETKRAPLNAVEWLNAIASGAGSLGGSKIGTASQPTPNPFLSLLAGGIGINSLLGGVL